ncbi:hypothetical protein BKA69DRAFT_105652 [Paraphysoderma sedebokerense]|nr:hypothetical protein BKA69DRAFT_105652 [Paraphysoderma sedebokerense]
MDCDQSYISPFLRDRHLLRSRKPFLFRNLQYSERLRCSRKNSPSETLFKGPRRKNLDQIVKELQTPPSLLSLDLSFSPPTVHPDLKLSLEFTLVAPLTDSSTLSRTRSRHNSDTILQYTPIILERHRWNNWCDSNVKECHVISFTSESFTPSFTASSLFCRPGLARSLVINVRSSTGKLYHQEMVSLVDGDGEIFWPSINVTRQYAIDDALVHFSFSMIWNELSIRRATPTINVKNGSVFESISLLVLIMYRSNIVSYEFFPSVILDGKSARNVPCLCGDVFTDFFDLLIHIQLCHQQVITVFAEKHGCLHVLGLALENKSLDISVVTRCTTRRPSFIELSACSFESQRRKQSQPIRFFTSGSNFTMLFCRSSSRCFEQNQFILRHLGLTPSTYEFIHFHYPSVLSRSPQILRRTPINPEYASHNSIATTAATTHHSYHTHFENMINSFTDVTWGAKELSGLFNIFMEERCSGDGWMNKKHRFGSPHRNIDYLMFLFFFTHFDYLHYRKLHAKEVKLFLLEMKDRGVLSLDCAALLQTFVNHMASITSPGAQTKM